MAVGKRKRRDQIDPDQSSADTSQDESKMELQALLQQHFEATFKPLKDIALPAKATQATTHLQEDIQSDWEGLSEIEDDDGPQVDQHHASSGRESDISKDELRAFMAWILCILVSIEANRVRMKVCETAISSTRVCFENPIERNTRSRGRGLRRRQLEERPSLTTLTAGVTSLRVPS